jgi:hypothetical protein
MHDFYDLHESTYDVAATVNPHFAVVDGVNRYLMGRRPTATRRMACSPTDAAQGFHPFRRMLDFLYPLWS